MKQKGLPSAKLTCATCAKTRLEHRNNPLSRLWYESAKEGLVNRDAVH